MGDWELDTVRPGKGTGVLVTMSERVSGFLRLGWSPNGKADEEVAMVITARLGRARDPRLVPYRRKPRLG